MRDLVSLAALPAVWIGCDEGRIAETLADALLNTLDLDFVCLKLQSAGGRDDLHVAWTAGGAMTPDRAREVGRELAPYMALARECTRQSIPNPIGSGSINIMCVPLGWASGEGALVAGSCRACFPGDGDVLLLRLGANQAALAVQRERAERASRLALERLVLGVRGSNIGMWEIDLPDGDLRNGRVDFTNVFELLGYGRGDELPTDFAARMTLVHPDDRALLEGAILEYLSGRAGKLEVEHRGRHRDGSYRWMLTRGVASRDAAGRPVRLIGSSTDVTEHKRTEEALRLASKRLNLAMRGSNIGTFEVDLSVPGGRVEWVNVWERMGYCGAEAPTDHAGALALMHPEDREPFDRAVRAYLDGQTAEFETEVRVRARDGTYRWFLKRGIAERDAAGKPVRFAGTDLDITERKRAEEALRQSEQRFRRYFELGLIGMAITSPTKGILEANDEVCRVLGYSREELLRKTWAEMTHSEDLPADVVQFGRVTAGEIDEYTMDKRWVRKDGRVIDTTISVNCVRRDDGSVDYFVALLQDVTSRKRAEAALRESEERFRGTFENAAVGIGHLDTNASYLRVNERLCAILGYTRAELLQRSCLGVTHPDDATVGVDLFGPLMKGELATFSAEKRYVRKDGSVVWVDMSVSLQRDPEGRPAYAIEIIQDISERKRLETELREAKEAAEAANGVKDRFLATVSHELRTPLAGILLWSQLLESRIVDDEAKALRTIRESAQAQQQLIEDLLDVSRVLAGEMRLDRRQVDLTQVVRAAVDIVRPTADAKGISIAESFDPRAGPVWADEGRVRQVVLNLLNNAVKFTPDCGRVSVRLTQAGGFAQVQIADTGQGITADFLPHVFDRFRQADASIARRHGGLGIGLAIARELVELHGGRIRGESPGKGQGATFTIELPVVVARDNGPVMSCPTRPAEAEWRFVPSPVLRGVRALVVEDDVTTREVIEYLLQQCDAEVTAIENAADALRMFDVNLPRKRFDVLLSDVGLPEMNGHELIRQIRAMERRSGEIPTTAVALTAYARDGDRAAALAAGFDTHLTKPVEAAALVRTVARCVGRCVVP